MGSILVHVSNSPKTTESICTKDLLVQNLKIWFPARIKKIAVFFFPSANHGNISGRVISLERKQNAAMENAIEEEKSDRY